MGERARLLAPPRAAPPASRAPGSLGEQGKKEPGGGGGGRKAGRRREGALGRRQAREEGARRASCRGGCPAPPRRPRGVRRAAAGGREAPGGRRLANSGVLGRRGSSLARPGPLQPLSSLQLCSPPPPARLRGGPGRSQAWATRVDRGWGARERGRGPWYSTLCQWLPWSRVFPEGRGRPGGKLRSLEVARPPPHAPRGSRGRGRSQEGDGLAAAAADPLGLRRSRLGMGHGVRGLGSAPRRGGPSVL